MNLLITHIRMLVRNSEGQDLLEYALLVALIAVVAAGAVGLAGGEVTNIFNDIKDELAGAPAQ